MYKDEILLEKAYHSIYEDNNPFKPASEDDIKDRKKHQIRLDNQRIQEYISVSTGKKSPEDMLTYRGGLDLSGSPIETLPGNLTDIKGSLDIRSTKNLKSLNKLKFIKGTLFADFSALKELPPGLKIHGNLEAESSAIETIPSDLYVGNTINLDDSNLLYLPDNYTVKGSLYIGGTRITSLPKGLTVRGSLNITSSDIQEVPPDLVVGGMLHFNYTPLSKRYTGEDITRIAPGVKHTQV